MERFIRNLVFKEINSFKCSPNNNNNNDDDDDNHKYHNDHHNNTFFECIKASINQKVLVRHTLSVVNAKI